MEFYNFRPYNQKADQILDEYELRWLVNYCKYNNTDKKILSQWIHICKSNRLRRRELRDDKRENVRNKRRTSFYDGEN